MKSVDGSKRIFKRIFTIYLKEILVRDEKDWKGLYSRTGLEAFSRTAFQFQAGRYLKSPRCPSLP